MTMERELKYPDANLEAVRSRLVEAGAESTGPYFESNLVFDYENRALRDSGILLRLRVKKGQAVLTVKKPPEVDVPSTLKIFEEIESCVDDFDAVKRALEAVGFVVAFAYEKVREKWRHLQCTVCLDRLPFGDFVEIEGTEETVTACAKSLGLDRKPTTKATYHALNVDYRRENGLEPDDSFVFSKRQRDALEKEIGKE